MQRKSMNHLEHYHRRYVYVHSNFFRHTTIILHLVSSCFLHTYSFFPTKGARRITVNGGKENWRRGKRIVVNNHRSSHKKKERNLLLLSACALLLCYRYVNHFALDSNRQNMRHIIELSLLLHHYEWSSQNHIFQI